MNKKFIFFCFLSFIIIFLFYLYKKKDVNYSIFTIGILKTATHPALNIIVEEFVKTLYDKSNGKIIIIEKNAEGSVINAHAIAQQFSFDKTIDIFFTIGTMATQSMINQEKERSIFFAAVSDPYALGIDNNQKNIAGISDKIPIDNILEVISSVFSNKKIGILYSLGEVNSTSIVEEIKIKAKLKNISFFPFSVTSETDLLHITELACKKCDLIILPTDNTIASGIKLISNIALKNTIPIFMTDISLMNYHGTFGAGVNYKEIGMKSAKLIKLILQKKKKISDIGFIYFEDKTLYIKKSMLSLFPKIILPKNLIYKEC